MRTLIKIVLVLLLLSLCGILGEFFAGVIGAIAAAYFHAGPHATTVIVRVLATVFFLSFGLLAWVIYSRRRERKPVRRNSERNYKDRGSEPQ
jgi:membrane protein implicated in regulation of membrane protease activity